jgi:hypothetical protein
MSALPQKRTFNCSIGMSALCQKQTFRLWLRDCLMPRPGCGSPGALLCHYSAPVKKLAATEGLYAHQLCPCQNVGKPRYCRSMGW